VDGSSILPAYTRKYVVFYPREAALGHPDPDLKSENSTAYFLMGPTGFDMVR
jgi:hypothetical protein